MTTSSLKRTAGSSETPQPERGSNIADLVAMGRRSRMVGRESILAEFRAAIVQDPFPYCVLQIHGPGGVGKTTVLDALAECASAASLCVITIDAKLVEPNPQSFLRLVGAALNLAPADADNPDRVLKELEERRRFVLLIDTYESVGSLDGWIRDEFVPSLPSTALLITAGRRAPNAAWRGDPGWQPLIRSIALRNFNPEESRDFLLSRHVPLDQHDAVLQFTHGYPLALSLITDVIHQHGGMLDIESHGLWDIVAILLERFLEETPTPEQRLALQTCALVRWTTEPLLSHVLRQEEVSATFEWLRNLSFMESSALGIAPHETAREALMADLKWRNPDQHILLHRRISDYYSLRARGTKGEEQERTLFDFVYLHRDNKVVADAFTWPENIVIYSEPIGERDIETIVKMVETHEGPESASIARRWLDHPAAWGQVYRKSGATGKGDRKPLGFALSIALEKLQPGDASFDPATLSALKLLQTNPPLRKGEVATFSRFWMDAEDYQGLSPVASVIVLTGVRYYLTTPGLAYTYFSSAEPEFWEAAYRYAEMHRLPNSDFEVGGRSYGMFGHDWRQMGPVEWLNTLSERELSGEDYVAPQMKPKPQPMVLSKPDFVHAVKQALKNYPPSESLADSPLLLSRLVADRVESDADVVERSERLRELLRSALDDLQTSGKRKTAYEILLRTYIAPEGTQEEVADRMDLPFSTYRRHLTTGIDLVTESLWAKEIAA